MEQAIYPSDLTDEEWQRLEPLVTRPIRRGRPRKYSLRQILHAIFYVIRTGCQWRALPHDLPKWKRPITIFGGGAYAGSGLRSTLHCVRCYEWRWVARHSPVRESSIVRV